MMGFVKAQPILPMLENLSGHATEVTEQAGHIDRARGQKPGHQHLVHSRAPMAVDRMAAGRIAGKAWMRLGARVPKFVFRRIHLLFTESVAILGRRRSVANLSIVAMLNEKRSYELKSAWEEAYERGPTWQKLLIEGLSQIPASTRDKILKTIERPRNIIPGLDLKFSEPVPRYDFERDMVTFVGKAGRADVRCAISREALDDNFGATTGLSNEQRLDKFRKNRSSIERMAREKYLNGPVEEPETVLIKTMEVPELLDRLADARGAQPSPR